VVPLAQNLIVQTEYAQRYFTVQEHHQYLDLLRQLGGGLNHLPGDFLTELRTEREGAQQEVKRVIASLRPLMVKLPDSQHYLQTMDQILDATTTERIGTELRLDENRQPTETRSHR
jgi:hypothetical protein